MMNIQKFMQRYELTPQQGRDCGGGFYQFTPVVMDLTERWEMEEDLKSMKISYKNDFCDNTDHKDFGKAILIFTLWDADWQINVGKCEGNLF